MKQPRNYILNKQGQPVPVKDLMVWAMWFEKGRSERIVKQEWVGNVRVSTVFLSIDHNWRAEGPPILWETMCFTNRSDLQGEMDRCSGNREQAQAMHQRMVDRVSKIVNKATKPKQ